MTTLPTYSIAAAHAYDHAVPGAYVGTAAGILLANGLGSILGPLLGATLMENTSAAMLFVFTATAQLGLAVFVISRLRTRAAPTAPEKEDFDLAATSAVGA